MFLIIELIHQKFFITRGKDCVQNFCIELREIAEDLFDRKKVPMIPLTPEQERFHKSATRCHICHTNFYAKDHVGVKSKNYRKVRDHDHYRII